LQPEKQTTKEGHRLDQRKLAPEIKVLGRSETDRDKKDDQSPEGSGKKRDLIKKVKAEYGYPQDKHEPKPSFNRRGRSGRKRHRTKAKKKKKRRKKNRTKKI
jgi:hypothetical protein